jgi:hypothetical protein
MTRFIDRILEWVARNRLLATVVVVITTTGIAGGVAHWYKQTYGVTLENRVTFLFTGLFIIFILLMLYLRIHRSILDDRFAWTVSVVNQLTHRIENINAGVVNNDAEQDITDYKWPWGNHNTKDLEHLAAAAERFWKLYDPDDFTTAPTNKVVAEWLVTTRGVARDRANYMASILRADGIPDGPRR